MSARRGGGPFGLRGVVVCAVTLAAGLALARPVHACGGFFCNQVPVDQRGEYLLFSIEADGTVVAHVQVRYEGAAEDFAWVLPLPAEPELSVGSDWIFSQLRARTEPSFTLDVRNEGNCLGGPPDQWPSYGYYPPGRGGCGGGGGFEGEGEVEVISEAAVGPYDTAVVRSDDPQALVAWLDANDYVIPDAAGPQIQAYVNEGDVFVALRLQKDRSIGDLQPIVLRFPEAGPCIPLRLTSIAATPNMPIYAFVLGAHRTVSTNFLDVELDPAALDWWNGGGNYRAVVDVAMNEVGGRGFVTEYAGSSALLREAFYREGDFDLAALRRLTDPAAFVAELVCQEFPRDATMMALLRRFIPMPPELADAGVDETSFYNCLQCYEAELAALDFDPNAFADALEELVVGPLREAQAMADRQPYLTRLYTTLSADEMTDDPIFRQNADLPDVPREQAAEGAFLCGARHDTSTAPFRLTLPDGRVMIYEPDDPGYPGTRSYEYRDDDRDGLNDDQGEAPTDLPSTQRATQQDEAGPGQVVVDNQAEIDRILAARYAAAPAPTPEPPTPGAHVPYRAGGGGCVVTRQRGHEGAGLVLAPALLALALRRRRRSP